ncbi:MAG: hypothetical protein JSS86_24385 [Cyanobacteria bacterium SZAS LIN-2]|nr:hypothetical protein [Cyanobacteria bacterium SZAS LIN-2]
MADTPASDSQISRPVHRDAGDAAQTTNQSQAAWGDASRACWAVPEKNLCTSPKDGPQMSLIPGKTPTLDGALASFKTQDVLPKLDIVGGDAPTQAAPAATDKNAQQQANAKTLLNPDAKPEDRIKAINELVKADVKNVDMTGADGKSYSLRLESADAGKSKMVHAFLVNPNGHESTAMRGILKADGTVEQQRDKKGHAVDFEGKAGHKMDAMAPTKMDLRTGDTAPPKQHADKPAEHQPPRPRTEPVTDHPPVKQRPEQQTEQQPVHNPPKPHERPARPEQPVDAPPQGKTHDHGTVHDPKILSRVPDAKLIGASGVVTSMANRRGEVQQYWLASDAAHALNQANQMLAAKGKQVLLEGKNAAGRTVDTQTEIYTRSHGGKTFAAGAPTSSNHTRGRALDIANYQDPDVARALKAVGFRQGDSHGPIKGDEHHFSFAGRRRQK